MADADLTLVVVDLSLPLEDEDRELIARAHRQGKWLLAGNKSDLPRRAEITDGVIEVSALTGAGIDALRAAIAPNIDQETGFTPACDTRNLLRSRYPIWIVRRLRSASTSPMRCYCSICTARSGRSTPLPERPRRTISSTGSSRHSV